MNRLYETEIQVDSIKQVNAANLSVLEGREPQFENMVQFFTENQFSLLKAIITRQPSESEPKTSPLLMQPSTDYAM